MPAAYSWDLIPQPLSGSAVDPGSYVAQTPRGSDPRDQQFVRAIHFANVPGAKASLVESSNGQVRHSNTLMLIAFQPIDKPRDDGRYSGAIKFRFRDYRKRRDTSYE